MASTKIPCIEDGAYAAMAASQASAITTEAVTWGAIQVALLVAQLDSSSFIADNQAALSNRRLKMAQEALDHAKNSWTYEQAFVSETMAEAKYSPEYGSVQIILNEVDRVEDLAVDAVDQRLNKFGITLGTCDDSRVKRGMATARTDLVSHSMRAAEARSIALNDRRYSRQLTAVGLGRGKLQNALSLGRLGSTGNAVRDSLINTINSGMQLWGYSANRWRHGGNYATGVNGAPQVVPPGFRLIQQTDPLGQTIYRTERDVAAVVTQQINTGLTSTQDFGVSDTSGAGDV